MNPRVCEFNLNWWHFMIAIPPMAILFASRGLINLHFDFNNNLIPEIESEHPTIYVESYKLEMISAFLLYIIVSAGLLAHYCIDFWHNTDKQNLKRIAIFAVCLSVCSAVYTGFFVLGENSFIRLIGEEWFKAAAEQDKSDNWGLVEFKNIYWTSAIVTAVLSTLYAASAISCLVQRPDSEALRPVRPPNGNGSSEPSASQRWKMQISRLQTITFYGSAVLIAGVLFQVAWTRYPMLLMHGEGAKAVRTAYSALADSLVINIGLAYTLTLASVVIPVAAILSHRANSIASSEHPKTAAQTATNTRAATSSSKASTSDHHGTLSDTIMARKESMGLNFNVNYMLKNFIAILSPLLTGALSSLLGAVG